MKLIFWLSHPPVACKGVFDAVAKIWDDKCYYVCEKGFDENRALLKVKTISETDNIEFIFASEASKLEKFILSHKDDYFVFNGYRGLMEKRINFLLKHNKKAKIMIWAERPTNLTPLHKALHYLYALKYRDKVLAFLPLGDSGVEAYQNLKWRNNNIYPFFYAPMLNEKLHASYHGEKTIKIVYIGRFKKKFKGVDVLLKALDLCCNKVSIDFAGGYGDDKDEVLAWINNHSYAKFIGTISYDNVCETLNGYDIVIIPSRYEGWNVVANQAIMACTGVIISDQAVSNELVSAFDCGEIFEANNANQLAEKIDYVCNHPDAIDKWKKNAEQNKYKISNVRLANYFIEIVNYSIDNKNKKPERPW